MQDNFSSVSTSHSALLLATFGKGMCALCFIILMLLLPGTARADVLEALISPAGTARADVLEALISPGGLSLSLLAPALLGVSFLACLVRFFRERAQWQLWTLFAIVILLCPMFIQSTVEMFNPFLASLLPALSTGIALIIFPHIIRHVLNISTISANADKALLGLSLIGATLAVLPFVPGFSNFARQLPLWGFVFALFLLPVLATIPRKIRGSKILLLACVLPILGSLAYLLFTLDAGTESWAQMAPAWGIGALFLLLGLAAPTTQPYVNYDNTSPKWTSKPPASLFDTDMIEEEDSMPPLDSSSPVSEEENPFTAAPTATGAEVPQQADALPAVDNPFATADPFTTTLATDVHSSYADGYNATAQANASDQPTTTAPAASNAPATAKEKSIASKPVQATPVPDLPAAVKTDIAAVTASTTNILLKDEATSPIEHGPFGSAPSSISTTTDTSNDDPFVDPFADDGSDPFATAVSPLGKNIDATAAQSAYKNDLTSTVDQQVTQSSPISTPALGSIDELELSLGGHAANTTTKLPAHAVPEAATQAEEAFLPELRGLDLLDKPLVASPSVNATKVAPAKPEQEATNIPEVQNTPLESDFLDFNFGASMTKARTESSAIPSDLNTHDEAGLAAQHDALLVLPEVGTGIQPITPTLGFPITLPLHNEVFNLRQIITEITEQMVPYAKDKGLTFTTTVHPQVATLYEGPAAGLGRLLSFLLENAIAHTEQGTVSLAIQATAARSVEFVLSDTGTTQLEQRDVLEICKAWDASGIFENSIQTRFSSTAGAVLRFTTHLALIENNATDMAGVTSSVPSLHSEAIIVGMREGRETLRTMLSPLRIPLHDARTPAEALSIYEQSRAPLIIFNDDLPLHDLAGIIAAIRATEKNNNFPQTSILGIAQHADLQDNLLTVGCNKTFTAPINPQELQMAVRKILELSHRERTIEAAPEQKLSYTESLKASLHATQTTNANNISTVQEDIPKAASSAALDTAILNTAMSPVEEPGLIFDPEPYVITADDLHEQKAPEAKLPAASATLSPNVAPLQVVVEPGFAMDLGLDLDNIPPFTTTAAPSTSAPTTTADSPASSIPALDDIFDFSSTSVSPPTKAAASQAGHATAGFDPEDIFAEFSDGIASQTKIADAAAPVIKVESITPDADIFAELTKEVASQDKPADAAAPVIKVESITSDADIFAELTKEVASQDKPADAAAPVIKVESTTTLDTNIFELIHEPPIQAPSQPQGIQPEATSSEYTSETKPVLPDTPTHKAVQEDVPTPASSLADTPAIHVASEVARFSPERPVQSAAMAGTASETTPIQSSNNSWTDSILAMGENSHYSRELSPAQMSQAHKVPQDVFFDLPDGIEDTDSTSLDSELVFYSEEAAAAADASENKFLNIFTDTDATDATLLREDVTIDDTTPIIFSRDEIDTNTTEDTPIDLLVATDAKSTPVAKQAAQTETAPLEATTPVFTAASATKEAVLDSLNQYLKSVKAEDASPTQGEAGAEVRRTRKPFNENASLFIPLGLGKECLDSALAPQIPELVQNLTASCEEAAQGRDTFNTPQVRKSVADMAVQAQKFGLTKLERMARCVERAAAAGDMEAVQDLFGELENVAARYQTALEASYRSYVGRALLP